MNKNTPRELLRAVVAVAGAEPTSVSALPDGQQMSVNSYLLGIATNKTADAPILPGTHLTYHFAGTRRYIHIKV